MITFDNAAIWVYAITRLDSLNALLGVASVLTLIATVGLAVIWVFSGIEQAEEVHTTSGRWAKRTAITLIAVSLVSVLVPTKQDAMLIAGVALGAQVAEKTIDSVSESEMVGKVLDIVNAKLEVTLDSMIEKVSPEEAK